MENPFDENKLGAQAIVDFSSIRKKNIEKNPSIKKEIDVPKEDMRAKINMARLNGEKEIEKYKALVSNFCYDTESLVLFRNVGDAVKGICINYILDSVIEPILQGTKPHGMPEDLFREMRKAMYQDLMQEYSDKK